jgi:hypothetical protein
VLREFEYIRHGTLCLMGGYNVRERKLMGFLSEDHDSETFVDLMDIVDVCHPEGRGHFVCDNLFAHNTDDVLDWLDDHPRWTMHFTPKHASWLNQIECAFSIVRRHAIARGSFASLDELRECLYQYMLWFNAGNRRAMVRVPRRWRQEQPPVEPVHVLLRWLVHWMPEVVSRDGRFHRLDLNDAAGIAGAYRIPLV